MDQLEPLSPEALPAGVRARFVPGINGLTMHILEAGFGAPGRPLVLLLHGFPELAYSWRKIIVSLAEAGFHVVAPDQRGYGRTTGWDPDYDGDVAASRMLNLARDAMGLMARLGHAHAAAVIGHDFGASVAAWCALLRPDLFRAMAIMSPFAGPPSLPEAGGAPLRHDIDAELAALPRPRKHYQWYYSTRPANDEMWHCRQGVHDFLRAYFHMKSANWPGNQPHKLAGWTAAELAKMPTYYIMDRDRNMAETVAAEMPSPAEIAACRWLTEDELAVYSGEYDRTGFQGGLNWYRCRTGPVLGAELEVFAGRTIDVPSLFVGGASDWGTYQTPGAFERMQREACTDMRGAHLVDGAGHWVQQEQPERVTELLLRFLRPAAA
ncbi:MAG TPA: alpha/beta hydrolase [Stellaceae bacterium]|nr:alpha/beta hydrolase [Stellaceae bacterium]